MASYFEPNHDRWCQVPPGSSERWSVIASMNAVFGAMGDNTTATLHGRVSDPVECANACKASSAECADACKSSTVRSAASGGAGGAGRCANCCKMWTWHDAAQGDYAHHCWFRLDDRVELVHEAGHITGFDAGRPGMPQPGSPLLGGKIMLTPLPQAQPH
jgi:hypothetical protein